MRLPGYQVPVPCIVCVSLYVLVGDRVWMGDFLCISVFLNLCPRPSEKWVESEK